MKKVSLFKFLPLVLVLGMVACSKPTSSPAPASSSPAPSQQSTQSSSSQAPSSQASSSSRPSSSQASSPSSAAPSSTAPSSQSSQGSSQVTPSGTKSGILKDAASAVTDNHQGTTEKDASWSRYTLPIRQTNTSDSGFATAYFSTSKADNVPADGGADSDGFYGFGGFRSATDATLTWTFNSATACEAGLYFELSKHTTQMLLGTYFDVKYGASNTPIDVTQVNLVFDEAGANSSASDKYIFVAYIQLVAGTNTVTVTRNATAPTGGVYNWWGMRLTTQSSAITAPTAA